MDLEATYRIVADAVKEHRPSTIISSFSGGYDSMAMTHVVEDMIAEAAPNAQYLVASVDTLLSADGWRAFVAEAASTLSKAPFAIWNNPDIELFIRDVERYGFVYREEGHKNYFYYLKQRVFRMMVKHYKTRRHDRVMFLNGVRRAESRQRRAAKAVDRRGSAVFVNPILHWSDWEVAQYRTEHNLPVNPFYDQTHNSGDCICNWHNRISVTEAQKHATKAWAILAPLHERNLGVFGYGYDEEPSASLKQEAAGQQRLFDWDTQCTPNLCAGCSKPEPPNAALDFVSLQRMEW